MKEKRKRTRTFRTKWFKKKVNGRMQRVILCPVCAGWNPKHEGKPCETCGGLRYVTRAMLVASAIEKLTDRIRAVEEDIREMKTVLQSVKQQCESGDV